MHPNHNQQHRFPWGVYIGDLHTEQETIPICLDSQVGGFCVLFDQESEGLANHLIENVSLKLFQALPVGLLHVKLFDYSHRKRFLHLADLQQIQTYQVALDSQQANHQFNALEKISQHRYHHLFSAQVTNLSQYNAQNTHLENYYLLLINLAHYPDDLASPKRLKAFFEAAYDAGFYCIAFADEAELDTENARMQLVLERFPAMHIRGKQVKFSSALFAFADAIVPSQFEYVNDNQELIVEQLLQAVQGAEEDEVQEFLRVPIGLSSDRRHPFYFSLGDKSQAYHGFLMGQTGSGKTSLLNQIILGIAKCYSSDQVRLYLMDYKEGVEFQVFQQHPNCEKIFLDNADLEAAMTLLEEFWAELQERGALFKRVGVSSIAAYHQQYPEQPLPRLVLIIDEVHRLFSGSFRQQEAFHQLLSQVVRQGRGFGVHVILATQTLAGANVQKELMSQIGLRMSYRLTDQRDAELLFGWENTVAMELGRFELLYNASSGQVAGNLRCWTDFVEDVVGLVAEYRAEHEQRGWRVLSPVVARSGVAEELVQEVKVDADGLGMGRRFDTGDYKSVL